MITRTDWRDLLDKYAGQIDRIVYPAAPLKRDSDTLRVGDPVFAGSVPPVRLDVASLPIGPLNDIHMTLPKVWRVNDAL